jgi:hypothetical protein
MKKYLILSILACTLASSTISLGMFKLLRTQQPSPAKRFYTSRLICSSLKKNIHNSSELEIATNAPELLEDLYDRNNNLRQHLFEEIEYAQKIVKILEQQNSIAVNHVYHEEPLNIARLKTLENLFLIEIAIHLRVSQNLHQFIITHNKPKGHANE